MTNGHSPRLADLLPSFALGALDGEDLRELEVHLATGCPLCAAELRRLADDLEAMALSAPPPPDPAAIAGAVKQRLLAELAPRAAGEATPAAAALPAGRGAAPVPPAGRRFSPAPWAGRRSWLPIAALLLLALWGIMRQSRLDAEIARLRGERGQLMARAGELERRTAQAQAEAEHLARTLTIIASPGVRSIELAGMGSSRQAVGRAYVDAADRRAVFYGYHLPVLPAGKTYQLWYVDDEDHNNSAGVFDVNPRGEGSLIVDRPLPVDRIQGWVVTIEPRGGRPQPTGPNALAG